MSYILEALKKAEMQREIGRVPGIESVHEIATTPPPRRRGWWILATVLVVALLIVGALWLRTPDVPGNVPDNTAQDSSSQPQPVPSRAQSDAPRTTAHRPAQTVTPEKTTRPTVAERPLKPLPLPPAPATDTSNSAAKEAVDQRGGPPHSTAARAGDPPERAAAPGRVPLWPLVPDDVFNQVRGRLALNVHVYSKNPDGRYIFLNMKKYGEGDRLFEGPVLEEITEDGVILSVRGGRFRLRAD